MGARMTEPGTEILSPDGQFRWDGQAWQPTAPMAQPASPGSLDLTSAQGHSRQSHNFNQLLRNRLVLVVGAGLVVAIGAVVILGGGSSSAGARSNATTACRIYDPNQNGDLRDESQLPKAIALTHAAANANPAYRNLADDFDQYNIDTNTFNTDSADTTGDAILHMDILISDGTSLGNDLEAMTTDCNGAA
jgi:hypothetical protein